MTGKNSGHQAGDGVIVLGPDDAWLDAWGRQFGLMYGHLSHAIESLPTDKKHGDILRARLSKLRKAANENNFDAAEAWLILLAEDARRAGLFKSSRGPGRPKGSKTRRTKMTEGMKRAREFILLKASGFKPNEAAARVASRWPVVDTKTVFKYEERHALALLYLELFKDEDHALDIVSALDEEEIFEHAKKYRGRNPDELAAEWIADLGENADPTKATEMMTVMAYCWVKLAALANSGDS